MDETETADPSAPSLKPMPLGTRLTNVIVAPGELFEHVRISRPAASNWLVPLILSVLLAALYGSVAFSQPASIQRIREQWQQAVQKQVSAGKITQQQADQQMTALEKVLKPSLVGAVLGVIMFISCAIFY